MRRLHRAPDCSVERVSRLYETEPVGPVRQTWFLNAVIAVETMLSPLELLNTVKAIEHDMGRPAEGAAERWGPRVIDIDVLLYGEAEVLSDALVVPHPELWNRRFVLAPLQDVLPAGALAERAHARLREIGELPVVRLRAPGSPVDRV